MKEYSEQLDSRYYAILEEEYDLERELARCQKIGALDLAANIEGLLFSLTAMPPLWSQAERFARETGSLGASDQDLESLRNAVIRALSPLLDYLPTTVGEMNTAIKFSDSTAAHAFAAARIIRIFGNEFDPH